MVIGNPLMVGGGDNLKNAYAIISVEYPAGSTVTCTNAETGKSYRAGNTYGAWAFGVNSGGRWTVTATQNGQTATANVDITAQGQAKSVELSHYFYLYDYEQGGEVNTDVTGGFTILKGSGSSCEVTAERIRFRNTDSSGQACRIMTANKLNMKDYSKICVQYIRTGTGKVMFGAALTNGTNDRSVDLPIAVTSTSAVSEPTVIECPIDSNDSYFVGVAGRTVGFDVSVYKIWLEPKI